MYISCISTAYDFIIFYSSIQLMLQGCFSLQDNSPTNQLAVIQVADWITRGLVNSPTANF